MILANLIISSITLLIVLTFAAIGLLVPTEPDKTKNLLSVDPSADPEDYA